MKEELKKLIQILADTFGSVEDFAWENFPDAMDEEEQEELRDCLNENSANHKKALAELQSQLAILVAEGE